ncbi:hypothetical protein [Streptomyces ipomoeae]|uniref:hypothetical protein n=1 Tax=Streptomyces ipomoeae TaxID=103232 RepID=UPI00031289F0|nr:hypothetical protein [Streptomyces ipomoeae]MDX2697463.1 hypothetical protein [Streptomyces ipomoeae]MDX2843210.1 hypothetical protein [Streptomyces ipomoeae]
MGNELMLGGFGQQPERRGRLTRDQRALVQRAEHDRDALLFEARKQEFTAALRLRMTEGAMHDVTDVVNLARQLGGDDPYLLRELGKLQQEFTRQTAHDIRSFGNGLGF